MTEHIRSVGSSAILPKWLVIALPLALTISSTISAHSAPVAPRPPAPAKNASTEYILGPEDVLEVTVSNHPDVNSTVTVGSNGKITLPRAGDVIAAGKSTRVLAQEIQNRLAVTLNNARVQILIKQTRPRRARIIGAVNSAGAYDLKSTSHLVDLIALAGGLSTKPTRVSGRIIRSGNVIPFDVEKAVAQPDSPSNVALRPEDLVVLDAQNYAKQITVTGSVKTPGAYDMDEGLTVMGLLAQAGGPLADASLRNSQVLRDGKPVLSDLTETLRGNLTADSPIAHFKLQPGDVLVVPQNQAHFSIAGQVAKPSEYPVPEVEGESTVFKAISQAGGPLADADLSEATITRTLDGHTQVIPVNVAQILSGKSPDTVLLQDRDILLIPKKDKQVNVIGQVAKPGSYPLEDGMTLLSLLAEAGNPSAGAGLSRAYVLRDGVQMPINLRAAIVDHLVDSQVADFQLKKNDVLVLPDIRGLVQVIGRVAKPGAYDLDDDLSTISLLSEAGNPAEGAALGKSYVLRQGTRIPFDLHSLPSGDLNLQVAAFRFAPGDVLVVPDAQTKLAVLGQVGRPGAYPYPENPTDATVLNVLTLAGGPVGGNAANLAQAGIVRNVDGTPQFIPVDLTQLLSNKKGNRQANVQLQPNDILFIPAKGQKTNPLAYLGPLATLGTIF